MYTSSNFPVCADDAIEIVQYFGEKEYADVRVFNTKDRMRRAFDEQEFSMWHVRPSVPSEEDSPDGGSGGADEHAAWLVRKMLSVGIDYLERMVSFQWYYLLCSHLVLLK